MAERLNSNLDELRRRAELESLRAFCIDSGCFAPSANPKMAAITMEELKKLSLDSLVGTNLLRAYMHGYFIDNRLYQKAKVILVDFNFVINLSLE